MSTLTSEQAITALEQSSKPTLDLLDDATTIVGLNFSERTLKHSVGSSTSQTTNLETARFREQWILRWVIKKLNQAVDVKQTSNDQLIQLLSDARLWNLLGNLLHSIPRHASKAIILERGFCHIIGDCMATCNTLADPKLSMDELPSVDRVGVENDRPSKKRKISHNQSAPECREPSDKFRLCINLLRIAKQVAEILLAVDSTEVSHRRSVPSNWTNGIEEAAAFIAQSINAATFVTAEYPRQLHLADDFLTDLATSLERWIELWQASVTSAQNQRKQASSLAFANHALIPALDFLATASTNSQRSFSRALERQIATACVLPMRVAFQKQFATTWDSASLWGTGETEPQGTKIQKVMGTLTSYLGESAAGFHSVHGEQRMANLLSIASRITPASDVVRRRADRPWIEALFLCLCLQRGTSDSSKKSLDGEMDVSPDISTSDNQLALPIFTSAQSLEALEATGIEPSRDFWHFYVRFVVSGGDHQISVATLAKMVGLNASVFVPEHDDATPSLLATFCETLERSQGLDDQSSRLIQDGVLAPIWEEFGKRRRLGLLIKFWESRLLDTFHLRSTATAEHSSNLLWDHPDLLDIFSSVCQRHAPPSLCTNMLSTTMGDIARLADIVGPTHEVFAKITILGSMLKFMGSHPAVQQSIKDDEGSMYDSLCKAISRKTDYQGHRWRLWKILEIFVQLSPTTLETTNLSQLELPWIHLSVAGTKFFDSDLMKSKPQLMELFQSFSYLVGLYESEQADSETMFTQVIAKLNEFMQLYKQHGDLTDKLKEPWNGLGETMDSASKLLSACLTRLSRCSRTWCFPGIMPDDLLKNMAASSFGQKDTDIFTNLAVAAEEILTQTTTSTKTNLLDTYSNTISTVIAMQVPPPLLHSVAQGTASEQQIHQFFEILFKTIQENPSWSHHGLFIQYLSLVTETILKHPDPAMSSLDFKSYIRFLGASTSEATTEQLAAAQQFIQTSTRQVFMQIAATSSNSKTKPFREQLLKWTRKQLEEIAKSDEVELLNRYTGYLLLAVAQTAYEVDATRASKKERKAIDEIKEHHAAAVVRQCMIIVGNPSDTINLWPVLIMLDSLVNPQDMKTVYKKLKECFQKVASAVVTIPKASPNDTKSNQQTRIIAKLWDVLSTHTKPPNSEPVSDFPHASFARSINEEQTESALVLQAQLAVKYPRQGSIASLARRLRLSKVTGQPEIVEAVSIAGSESYLSIAASIRSLKLNDSSADVETIEVLGHIACLQTAPDEISPASLIIRLELSKMVLDKHSSIVSQHVIDSTLTSITNLASSASKAISTPDSTDIKPEYIFDRLCTILSTLLVRYRRRLTGRHHLLLPALQNLLKCLFYPASRKNISASAPSRLTYLSSLPTWLNTPSHNHMNNLTLPASSATKFSRLLQLLCDPSASSARHVSKRPNDNSNLTDNLKSLRREVSRHTQYLLQTYCQVMLDGYIAPDAREKLLPGLYAAMNAMDVEVMRALNASMDASQRAIWKDLYAEWRRFGRWNQR